MAGADAFLVLNAIEPFEEADFLFFARLYLGIGAVTGMAAWYASHLTALGRLTVTALIFVLLLPFAFILLLAVDKNPLFAVLAMTCFGFIVLLAWLGQRTRLRSAGT
jgi:hypothetical protein